MGIKERQERERESIRTAILEAARDLFVAEGYSHVSIRKIAERIEYSPASIYSYFPSKDDIFFALAEEGFRLLYDLGERAAVGPDPLTRLKAQLRAFYQFSTDHPEHFALMFLDRSVPRIGAHYQRFRLLIEMKQRTCELIAACVAAGQLPGADDPISMFRVLTTPLVGVAGMRIFGRHAPGEDCGALANDVIETTIAGLRTGVALTFRAAPSPCAATDADIRPAQPGAADAPANA